MDNEQGDEQSKKVLEEAKWAKDQKELEDEFIWGKETIEKAKESMKYFTPDIEDIRVGYECEKAIPDYSSTGGKPLGWEKHIIGEDFNIEEFDLRGMNTYVLWGTKYLRVPYLTKEQIEAEGWKDEYGNNITFIKRYEDGSYYYFKFWNGDNPIDALIGKYTPSKKDDVWSLSSREIVFKGECKDINTFRYICKLLKIN